MGWFRSHKVEEGEKRRGSSPGLARGWEGEVVREGVGGAISAARDWGSLLGEQKLHLQMNSRDKSHNFSGLSRSHRGFCQPQPSFSLLIRSCV